MFTSFKRTIWLKWVRLVRDNSTWKIYIADDISYLISRLRSLIWVLYFKNAWTWIVYVSHFILISFFSFDHDISQSFLYYGIDEYKSWVKIAPPVFLSFRSFHTTGNTPKLFRSSSLKELMFTVKSHTLNAKKMNHKVLLMNEIILLGT